MTTTDPTRRDCRRYRVPAAYTAVTARRGQAAVSQLQGHVYDISASGVRIELDEALHPGECVVLSLDLPGARTRVSASASVVWINDTQDDPGPRRMALRFTSFSDRGDRDRLIDYLGTVDRHAA
ncbi:MAG: PilZ domain-containing protein [Planctomycetota bacterium]|jgi:c-di-GMP-binding flagellar brake protein YcgR